MKPHPLRSLAERFKMTGNQMMDYLQVRGLVSDNAIECEDVADCDVQNVLAVVEDVRAGRHYKIKPIL